MVEFVPNEIDPPLRPRSLELAGTPAGDAYTLTEHQHLAEAGFKNVTGHPLPGPETAIVGVK